MLLRMNDPAQRPSGDPDGLFGWQIIETQESANDSPVKIPSRRVYSEIAAIAKSLSRSPLLPQEFFVMPKRTFQPNRRHRAKTHGFLSRMKTKAGAAVLSRRRAKGRHKIAVSAGFRD